MERPLRNAPIVGFKARDTSAASVPVNSGFQLEPEGILKRTAQQLMVFGFFEEVIEKFDNEEIKNNVRELVQSKFHL